MAQSVTVQGSEQLRKYEIKQAGSAACRNVAEKGSFDMKAIKAVTLAEAVGGKLLSGKEDLLWISAEELREQYAIPSAFAAYTRYIWDGF